MAVSSLTWGWGCHLPRPVAVATIAVAIAVFASIPLATPINAQATPPAKRQDPATSTRLLEMGLELLGSARTLRCTFDSGFTTTLYNGNRHTDPAAASFGLIVYDNIDRQRRSAREITSAAGKDVHVITSATVLTFLEVTGTGNPVVTSVFPMLVAEGSRTLPAVTSRHITPGLMTDIAPRITGIAQYYGTCEVPPF